MDAEVAPLTDSRALVLCSHRSARGGSEQEGRKELHDDFLAWCSCVLMGCAVWRMVCLMKKEKRRIVQNRDTLVFYIHGQGTHRIQPAMMPQRRQPPFLDFPRSLICDTAYRRSKSRWCPHNIWGRASAVSTLAPRLQRIGQHSTGGSASHEGTHSISAEFRSESAADLLAKTQSPAVNQMMYILVAARVALWRRVHAKEARAS